MLKNIFGTAGIRSKVGQYPLDPNTLTKIGKILSKLVVNKYGKNSNILIACDTRLSSDLIKSFIKSGLLQNQISLYDAQVLPTPAIYYLVHKMKLYDLGIVITASHNPHTDNGIKIVDKLNNDLSNEEELWVSEEIKNSNQEINYNLLGKEYHVKSAQSTYIQKIIDQFSSQNFKNIPIVIDCANGATSEIALHIFKKLGLKVNAINTNPNGTNINNKCGSTYPHILQKLVLKNKAEIGFAFDGDGDRIVAVNKNGEILDGDKIIAFLSTHPNYNKENKLVSTIVSNYGLEKWITQQNKKLLKSNVGEKNVLKEMNKNKVLIGGESSGHIILKDFANHSDGIFIALKIIETAILNNNWLLKTFTSMPQVTNNITVKEKKDLTSAPLANIVDKYQKLAAPGRLIIRYSGTENLLRVLFEGEDIDTLNDLAKKIELELSPLLCQ